MNKKKVSVFVGITVIIAALAVWFFILKPDTSKASENTANNLQGIEAVPGSVAIKVEGPSVAEPYRIQTIRAAIEGTVVSAKEEGDTVKAGEVIVKLDENDTLTAIKQAEINLAKAKLTRDKNRDTLEKAIIDLDGKKKLLASGAVSADQVDLAKTAVDNARYALKSSELDLAQSELTLEIAKKDFKSTAVKAPFTGVILSSTLVPGDIVNKGEELITVADISRIILTAEIDEFDIGKVKKGQTVSITSDSLGNKILTSVVDTISPAAEVVNNISIFNVSTIIDNKKDILKPGMSADISILIKSDSGLIIPSKAVSRIRTRSYVKVYEKGEIKTKRIKTGADNGINIVVLDGLKEGDMVVVKQAPGFSLTPSSSTGGGSSVIPVTIPGMGVSK